MKGFSSDSYWIQAHAGSGKTHTMIEHLTRLLIRGAEPESIVCLTYTKAAAAEMRERLDRHLRHFASLAPNQLQEKLTPLLGHVPHETELRRAAGLLRMGFDSPQMVQFFTIHGFCQSLLSHISLEANLPLKPNLLDDGREAEMLSAAFQRLLAEAATDTALRDSLRVLQATVKDRVIESLLAQSTKHGAAIKHLSSLDDAALSALLGSVLPTDHVTPLPELIDIHRTQSWCAQASAAIEALRVRGTVQDKVFAAALEAYVKVPSEQTLKQYVYAFFTASGGVRKAVCGAAVKKDYPVIAAWLTHEQAFAQRLRLSWADAQARALSHAFIVLSRRYLHWFEYEKRNAQAVTFDDLLAKTRDVLANDALRAWLLSKLDAQFQHLLIDEAQDTSPEQWDILRYFILDLWQTPSDNARSLFVVGDSKQSIYSFQGADLANFMAEKSRILSHFSHIQVPMQQAPLKKSYRSAALIMRVVNAVLEQPLMQKACGLGERIEPHETQFTQLPARVECLPIAAANKREKQGHDEPLTEYHFAENAQLAFAETLASQISGWLQEKRPLKARGRAVKPEDILILLRRRKPALAIIQALEKQGVPVSGLDRLKLADHLAVRDFLALIEWALHPYDDYNLSIALRSPIIGLSEDALFALLHARTGTVWDALREHPDYTSFALRLANLRSLLLTEPIDMALHRMLSVYGFRKAYCARFGEEVLEVLDALLCEAERFAAQHMPPTARAFASHLMRYSSTIKRENEHADGHVRVMTVHGSKGLEAPIVILADATLKPKTGKESVFWMNTKQGDIPLLSKGEAALSETVVKAKDAHEQLAYDEYCRLLYVALTRAEDELYVGGVPEHSSIAEDSWYGIVSNALVTLGAMPSEHGGLVLEDAGADAFSLRPDKQANEHISGPSAALPAWLSAIAPAEKPASRIYSPSSIVAHKPEATSAPNGDYSAAERGVAIHGLLQWVEAYKPNNMDELSEWVALTAPHWPSSIRSAVTNHIWQLYTQPEWQFIWQGRCYNEVNIAGSLQINGEWRKFSGQIDRLIVHEGARIVIDYKTSARVPAYADIPHTYKIQMLTYKKLLEADGSGLPVRTALLYTSGPTLYWLDEELSNLAFPSLDAA